MCTQQDRALTLSQIFHAPSLTEKGKSSLEPPGDGAGKLGLCQGPCHWALPVMTGSRLVSGEW